jgi:hypothetical protein
MGFGTRVSDPLRVTKGAVKLSLSWSAPLLAFSAIDEHFARDFNER